LVDRRVHGRFWMLRMGDVRFLRRLADGEVGNDRTSLSFPVVGFDESAFPGPKMRRRDDGALSAESYLVTLKGAPGGALDGASVTVGLSNMGGRWWGKVEANPSRFADPRGCSLLPLAEWPASVELMADAVWRLGVVPAIDVEQWRVKRLDLARDFRDVVAPEFYVRGLAPLRRSHNKRSGLWSDADCGTAQTLHVGSGAGMVRLYDQHAAYASKGAAVGSLRWEVEARRGWLDRHGVSCVGDVSVGRCEDIAWERWEWSRMGETVTGASNVVEAIERVVRQKGYFDSVGVWRPVSRTKADRALGLLVRESLGRSGPVSNDSHAEYERLKRYLGVTPSAELFEGADVSVAGRLDFEHGVEICA
jgi:hypothetical protein